MTLTLRAASPEPRVRSFVVVIHFIRTKRSCSLCVSFSLSLDVSSSMKKRKVCGWATTSMECFRHIAVPNIMLLIRLDAIECEIYCCAVCLCVLTMSASLTWCGCCCCGSFIPPWRVPYFDAHANGPTLENFWWWGWGEIRMHTILWLQVLLTCEKWYDVNRMFHSVSVT